MVPKSDEAAGSNAAGRAAVLLTKHHSFILGYLLSAVRDFHAAEDLHQEVSLYVIENVDRYLEGTSFLDWIREICRIRVLRHFRKTGRNPLLLPDGYLESMDRASRSLDDPAFLSRRKEILRECLNALGRTARHVVELRYADALTVGQIAQSVGRTLHTTYDILKRARRALQRCMERKTATEAMP